MQVQNLRCPSANCRETRTSIELFFNIKQLSNGTYRFRLRRFSVTSTVPAYLTHTLAKLILNQQNGW